MKSSQILNSVISLYLIFSFDLVVFFISMNNPKARELGIWFILGLFFSFGLHGIWRKIRQIITVQEENLVSNEKNVLNKTINSYFVFKMIASGYRNLVVTAIFTCILAYLFHTSQIEIHSLKLQPTAVAMISGHFLYFFILRPFFSKFTLKPGSVFSRLLGGWDVSFAAQRLTFHMRNITIGKPIKRDHFIVDLSIVSDFRIFKSFSEAEIYDQSVRGSHEMRSLQMVKDQINFMSGKIDKPSVIIDSAASGLNILLVGSDFYYRMFIHPNSEAVIELAQEEWKTKFKKL